MSPEVTIYFPICTPNGNGQNLTRIRIYNNHIRYGFHGETEMCSLGLEWEWRLANKHAAAARLFRVSNLTTDRGVKCQ